MLLTEQPDVTASRRVYELQVEDIRQLARYLHNRYQGFMNKVGSVEQRIYMPITIAVTCNLLSNAMQGVEMSTQLCPGSVH